MSLEDPDSNFLSWFCGDFLSVGKILTVIFVRQVGFIHGLQSWLLNIDHSCPPRSLNEEFLWSLKKLLGLDVVGVWFNYVVLIFSGAGMYQMCKGYLSFLNAFKVLPKYMINTI